MPWCPDLFHFGAFPDRFEDRICFKGREVVSSGVGGAGPGREVSERVSDSVRGFPGGP